MARWRPSVRNGPPDIPSNPRRLTADPCNKVLAASKSRFPHGSKFIEPGYRQSLACRTRRPAALLPPWGLARQPRPPKRLSHSIAAGWHGIASAGTRLGRSETVLRSRWGDFGACCGRPRFRSLIEPHCQRDPTALRVDLQHFDTDDIAGLRDLAWVLDVSIGHRGDVHQPVLVDPHIDKGTERGDVRHDTFENHAGLQILELFHPLAKRCRLESRARIASGFFELP